jgi:hypothetical protein
MKDRYGLFIINQKKERQNHESIKEKMDNEK